jgi:hypothetical protein
MANQALFYTCMFRAAWATLRKFFGKQGLQGGMTGILHTWGSNLFYHPHIHCIVTGGGVDRDGIWHPLKSCRGNRNFLFPVHALSKVFRAYGLLSPSNREKVRQVQIQLGGTPVPKERKKKPYMQICAEKGWNIGICPNCKCSMIIVEIIAPTRAPPVKSTNSQTAH